MYKHQAQFSYLDMTDILILYANSGFFGHRIIAHNYENLLKKQEYEIHCFDVLDLDKTSETELGNKLYLWGIKAIPWLWRMLYSSWAYIPFSNWLRTSILPRYFPNTQNLVIELNPRIIISTHPLATLVLSYLKSLNLITGKIFVTFSDWHIQPFWLAPHVDKYLVAIPQQKADLIQIGITVEQITVTGMLLNETFYQSVSKQVARKQLNIRDDKRVILIMGGGMGWRVEELVSPLINVRGRPHIIIVGANEKRKEDIEDYIRKTNIRSKRISVKGFVDTSAYISAADLLISKPGGLTTSEAFLLKTPILTTTLLPGQEEWNMSILKNKRAVLHPDKGIDLAAYIDNLFCDPAFPEVLVTEAFKLAPRFSPGIVVTLVQNEMALS